MVTERQIRETVARCVSTMVFYHNCERSRRAVDQMTAEVHMIAGFVDEWGIDEVEIERRITRPVEVELIARYGHELGPKLLGDFLRAYASIKPVGR